MNSVSQHIPKVYLRPSASELPKAEPFKSSQPPGERTAEHIIEAEWRPISGSPVRSTSIYPADSVTFSAEAASLTEKPSAALVSERYQPLRQKLDPGSIVNIQA